MSCLKSITHIVVALRAVAIGVPVEDVCASMSIKEKDLRKWQALFGDGGMLVTLERIYKLENENERLRSVLDNVSAQYGLDTVEVLRKYGSARAQKDLYQYLSVIGRIESSCPAD